MGSVSSLNCFMRREALAAELLLFIMDGAESELVGDEGGVVVWAGLVLGVCGNGIGKKK